MRAGYRLKRRRGFFAAGTEFARALGILGGGALKLFANGCLKADRASGRMVFERADLARRLGTSRSALRRHPRERVRAGVCELETTPNQHGGYGPVLWAAYWPYRATSAPPTSDSPPPGSEREFRRRRCGGRSCWAACASP